MSFAVTWGVPINDEGTGVCRLFKELYIAFSVCQFEQLFLENGHYCYLFAMNSILSCI